jgi:hypothetical protein
MPNRALPPQLLRHPLSAGHPDGSHGAVQTVGSGVRPNERVLFSLCNVMHLLNGCKRAVAFAPLESALQTLFRLTPVTEATHPLAVPRPQERNGAPVNTHRVVRYY